MYLACLGAFERMIQCPGRRARDQHVALVVVRLDPVDQTCIEMVLSLVEDLLDVDPIAMPLAT